MAKFYVNPNNKSFAIFNTIDTDAIECFGGIDAAEYIEKLEKELKRSNDCLKSILYCPEQVNWNGEPESYKPVWLQVQIVNNEKLLEAEDETIK